MEPVGVVGLVASCVGLAARAVQSARELDDFIKSYRGADRSVSKLATQLRVFALTIDELEKLLDGSTIVSDALRETIRSSIQDWGDILGELEEHVQKVVVRSDGSKGLPFAAKIRVLWSQGLVAKEEQTLNRQLQLMMLLMDIVRKNDAAKQDSTLREPGSKKTIAKSARDARSIRLGRDTNSISTSVRSGGSNWPSSENTEVELAVDE
ncbi:hypothetical protein ACJ41O_012958 [Fusarium nematophilum]